MMMGYGAGAWFGLGGWLAVLGCIALVVGLVALVLWAFSRSGVGRDASTPTLPAANATPNAMEILRLRFARGEITAEEFDSAKQTLGGDR